MRVRRSAIAGVALLGAILAAPGAHSKTAGEARSYCMAVCKLDTAMRYCFESCMAAEGIDPKKIKVTLPPPPTTTTWIDETLSGGGGGGGGGSGGGNR